MNMGLYAYAANNPVRYTDRTGNCPNCLTALAGAAAGFAVGGLHNLYTQMETQDHIDWGDASDSAGKGGAIGMAVGFAGPWGAVAAGSAGTTLGAAHNVGQWKEASRVGLGNNPETRQAIVGTALVGAGAVGTAKAGVTALTRSSGGRTWLYGFNKVRDEQAAEAYAMIRESTTDVAAISRYTKYKPDRIQRIKDYLFSNKDWEPDGDTAAAWHRLRTGRGTETDRLLLKHETAEMWYRKNVDSCYSKAHQCANRHWNWQREVEKEH